MFFRKRSIFLKSIVLGAIVSIGLLVGLTPQTAHAAGETYTFTDSTNTAITVNGGSNAAGNPLNAAGKLTQTSAASGLVYVGPVTLTCGTNDKVTGKIELTLNAVNKSTGTVLVSANAACGSFDGTVALINSDGSIGSSTNDPNASGCDNGSFSWIVCPFTQNVTGAVTTLATKVLVPLLEIKPLTATSTPQLHATWLGMLYFADAVFALIFVIVIFATITQQDIPYFDQYTIKKILPRVVIAAILVQASFAISGLLVDFGNVLGAGIPSLLSGTLNPHNAPAPANIITNLVGVGLAGTATLGAALGIASWTAVVPILLTTLISLLAVFLVLGLRFLVIAILVALSPLALAAWVLPNTRKWAHEWMKLFFDLILMYPIIILLLTFGHIVNEILPASNSVTASGPATLAVAVIKPLIVIAVFIAIPASFKLAGRGVSRAYEIIQHGSKRTQGMLRGSDFWKEGKDMRDRRKASYMQRLSSSSAITSLNSKGGAGRFLAGSAMFAAGTGLIGAPTTQKAITRAVSKNVNRDKKWIDEFAEGKNPGALKEVLAAVASGDSDKIKETRNKFPLLMSMAQTPIGLEAIANQLADKDSTGMNDVQQFLNAKGSSNPLSVYRGLNTRYPALLSQVQKESTAKPTVIRRVTATKPDYVMKDELGYERQYRDASGAVVMDNAGKPRQVVIDRQVGDLDINATIDAFSKVAPRSIGDKLNIETFNVMKELNTKPASKQAYDAGIAYYSGMSRDTIVKALDVTGRNSAPTRARVEMLQAMQATRGVAAKNKEWLKKYEEGIRHLAKDPDAARILARQAGATNDSLLGAMSDKAIGEIAIDYMRGVKFEDTYDNYTNPYVAKTTPEHLQNIDLDPSLPRYDGMGF